MGISLPHLKVKTCITIYIEYRQRLNFCSNWPTLCRSPDNEDSVITGAMWLYLTVTFDIQTLHDVTVAITHNNKYLLFLLPTHLSLVQKVQCLSKKMT